MPRPHVVHMPETAESIKKLKFTLVNGVTKMVPPGSGTALLDFVTRVMFRSELLSPAPLFHDPVSFQVRCSFRFCDHKLRESREFVVP